MSEATQHLQSVPRKIHRCDHVTVAEQDGQILVARHTGRWRGRAYPAVVVCAVDGPVEEIIDLARDCPMIEPGAPNRRDLQEQEIAKHFASRAVEHTPEDALTAVYLWDM